MMTVERAAWIEARRLAREEVKADLRRKGIKPQLLAAKTITLLANLWLEKHPQLFEEARERVQGWLGSKLKTSATAKAR